METVTNGRPPRVDRVAEQLRDGIRGGRYVPGQRLVEVDLTGELAVSRQSLREALRRLAGEGLVTIQPYQGATVRKWSRREIDEIFALRELLEGEAARLAATRIDDDDIRPRFEASLSVFTEFTTREPEPLRYDEENTRLHHLIVDASGNRQLRTTLETLHIQAIRHEAGRLWPSRAIQRSITQHITVIERILAGDATGAERAMKRHVSSFRQELLDTLAPESPPLSSQGD